MNKALRLCALAVTLVGASLDATAAGPSLKSVTDISGLVYSPDSAVKGAGKAVVQSGGYVGPFCVVFTQLALTPSPSSAAEAPSFGLYEGASSPTKALALDGAPSTADELLSGGFAEGSPETATAALDFSAILSPAPLPAPGSYIASFRARLYASAYPPAGEAVDSATFSVSIQVDSHFDISIGGQGSAFSLFSTNHSLDFGSLAANDSRSADILVRSNVGYSLSIASVRGGALANTHDGSLLAYTLSANGLPLDLGSGLPASLAVGASATYGSFERYRIVVTISNFAELPSEGDYTDMLTITLMAL